MYIDGIVNVMGSIGGKFRQNIFTQFCSKFHYRFFK